MPKVANHKRGWFLFITAFFTVSALAVLFFATPLAEAVTVGPAKIEAQADPGDMVEGEFFLKNEEDQARTLYSAVQKFSEDGGTKVFLNEPTPLSNWLSLPEQVTLGPGEETRFDFAIDLPQDAPPGGHFAVIWWSPTPPAGSGTTSQQVSITTRAGALLYLNISGDVQQTAEITNLSVSDMLVGEPELDFSLAVNNTGNVYITPAGTMEITSLLGSTRAELPVNAKNLQILPESSKTLQIAFSDDGWYWGPYRAEASVRYGDGTGNNNMITATRWFWVIPPTATIVTFALLLLLIFGGPVAVRRYNRWVVRRSRGQGEG